MARDEKISMPTGQSGIVRYFDEYKSRVEFKPGHVILMALVVILLELFLHIR